MGPSHLQCLLSSGRGARPRKLLSWWRGKTRVAPLKGIQWPKITTFPLTSGLTASIKSKPKLIRGGLGEPLVSNLLYINAGKIYEDNSRENATRKEKSLPVPEHNSPTTTVPSVLQSGSRISEADSYVYANVDTNYTPQFVETVPIETLPVLTPIPPPIDMGYGILPENSEEIYSREEISPVHDSTTEKLTSSPALPVRKENEHRPSFNQQDSELTSILSSSEVDEPKEAINFGETSSSERKTSYNSDELLLYSNERHYFPADTNKLNASGLSNDAIAGIVSAFVIAFLLIVGALLIIRYRHMAATRSKGTFTASSSMSSKTTDTNPPSTGETANHIWLSIHKPNQIELLDQTDKINENSSVGEDCSIRYSGLPIKCPNADFSVMSQSCDSLLMPMIPPSNFTNSHSSSNSSSSSTNTSYLSNASGHPPHLDGRHYPLPQPGFAGHAIPEMAVHHHPFAPGHSHAMHQRPCHAVPAYHTVQMPPQPHGAPLMPQAHSMGYQVQEEYAEIIEPASFGARDMCCPNPDSRSSFRSVDARMPPLVTEASSQYPAPSPRVPYHGPNQLGVPQTPEGSNHSRSHSHSSTVYQTPTPDILPRAPYRSKPFVPHKPRFVEPSPQPHKVMRSPAQLPR